MKLYYDLHIHSALSPCGDEDMTPNNIVNMALIKGLDIIAVTDHNSVKNVRAVTEVAGDRLLVVPGMEVESSEEVHMVCYFPDISSAEKMGEIVRKNLPDIKNKPEIFGEQYVMDTEDRVIDVEDRLLVNATTMDIYEIFASAKELGGIAVPAHIDRTSYSILSNLGFLPPDIDFTAVEITKKNLNKLGNDYSNYKIITNSDAHYLQDISEREKHIDISDKNVKEIINFLCKKE